MGVVRPKGRVKPGSKIWGPEPPMPWSLGLPVFDEKKGKYVPRKPFQEPKTPEPNIHDTKTVWTPLHKGYDAYMRKKEAHLKKGVQAAKRASMRKESHDDIVDRVLASAVDGRKVKKMKEKKYFWEKPKPRKPPKMLSTRGERVMYIGK